MLSYTAVTPVDLLLLILLIKEAIVSSAVKLIVASPTVMLVSVPEYMSEIFVAPAVPPVDTMEEAEANLLTLIFSTELEAAPVAVAVNTLDAPVTVAFLESIALLRLSFEILSFKLTNDVLT
ncbi:hypothetical protein D3C75_892340 [compost metagenome]